MPGLRCRGRWLCAGGGRGGGAAQAARRCAPRRRCGAGGGAGDRGEQRRAHHRPLAAEPGGAGAADPAGDGGGRHRAGTPGLFRGAWHGDAGGRSGGGLGDRVHRRARPCGATAGGFGEDQYRPSRGRGGDRRAAQGDAGAGARRGPADAAPGDGQSEHRLCWAEHPGAFGGGGARRCGRARGGGEFLRLRRDECLYCHRAPPTPARSASSSPAMARNMRAWRSLRWPRAGFVPR